MIASGSMPNYAENEMIRLIEALNYRCLRYVKQPLKDFQVLVGPNASGKTTFLDVIGFLSDLVNDGLLAAVEKRGPTFYDLPFNHEGDRFELAVEMAIPPSVLEKYDDGRRFDTIRYEIAIGMTRDQAIHIFDEKVLLQESPTPSCVQRELFPMPPPPPKTIIHSRSAKTRRTIISKKYDGNDNYNSEVHPKGGKGWIPSIRLGPTKSALRNAPAMAEQVPATFWMRDVLASGVQTLMLSSMALRHSSPPGKGYAFQPDGSNLPWVLHRMEKHSPDLLKQWVEHVRTALPDIEGVDTREFPDTRHRYLRLIYQGGLVVPSWMASDGTLRLLALTLPAYLPEFEGVYLIEEPENGIHPMAMETVLQSMKSVYSAQILMATHSPVILAQAAPGEVLCFSKDDSGATDVVPGDEHPKLKDWQGNISFSDLYASGVLG